MKAGDVAVELREELRLPLLRHRSLERRPGREPAQPQPAKGDAHLA